MNTASFYVALILLVGLVLLISEPLPQLMNGLLVLLIVSVIVMRWEQFAPLVSGLQGVAGGLPSGGGK